MNLTERLKRIDEKLSYLVESCEGSNGTRGPFSILMECRDRDIAVTFDHDGSRVTYDPDVGVVLSPIDTKRPVVESIVQAMLILVETNLPLVTIYHSGIGCAVYREDNVRKALRRYNGFVKIRDKKAAKEKEVKE